MDATTFFAYARRAPFGGRLLQGQIDGMTALFRCRDSHKISAPDKRHFVYILASVSHETGGTMLPVRETFDLTDAGAIAALDKAYRPAGWCRCPNPTGARMQTKRAGSNVAKSSSRIRSTTMPLASGSTLTWSETRHSPLISIPAQKLPSWACWEARSPAKSCCHISVSRRMIRSARAVVNGRDKAKLIAGYYKSFLDALEAAPLAYYQGQPDDVAELDAEPDNVPAMKSKSLLTIIGSFLGALGLGAVDDLKVVVESGSTLFARSPSGLTPAVDSDLAKFVYDWIGQQDESNLHFLRRLAQRHNGLFSIKQGRLLFSKLGSGRSASGNNIGSVIITPEMVQLGSLKFDIGGRTKYSKVIAYYQDSDKAQRVEIEADADAGGESVYRIPEPFSSPDEADKAAQAKAKSLKRGEGSTSVTHKYVAKGTFTTDISGKLYDGKSLTEGNDDEGGGSSGGAGGSKAGTEGGGRSRQTVHLVHPQRRHTS